MGEEKVKKLVLTNGSGVIADNSGMQDALSELDPVMESALEGVSINDLMADGHYDYAMKRILKECGGDKNAAAAQFEGYYAAAQNAGNVSGRPLCDWDITAMLERIDEKIAEVDKTKESGMGVTVTSSSVAGVTPAPAQPAAGRAGIDQDPYEREKFAQKLIDYHGDLLEICWRMKEHLNDARPYMNGSHTFLSLLDQLEATAAAIQKRGDAILELGNAEKKHARYLIELYEKFGKFEVKQ